MAREKKDLRLVPQSAWSITALCIESDATPSFIKLKMICVVNNIYTQAHKSKMGCEKIQRPDENQLGIQMC